MGEVALPAVGVARRGGGTGCSSWDRQGVHCAPILPKKLDLEIPYAIGIFEEDCGRTLHLSNYFQERRKTLVLGYGRCSIHARIAQPNINLAPLHPEPLANLATLNTFEAVMCL